MATKDNAGTLVNETTTAQLANIRAHLERYGVIGAREARDLYGCERLGARIWDLRHMPDGGMNIRTERVKTKNRFGQRCIYALYYYDREEGTENERRAEKL